MRKKKQEALEDAGSAGGSVSPRLTPEDVQHKEFRLAFRGYNERDVDAFLDEVTEELGAYLDEIRRLRLQPETGQPAGTGASDSDSEAEADLVERASREAQEILARAGEEAERIVADARAQADQLAASAASAGARPTDTRSVIAPFLGREREFLQSLGKLVQEHAESVRGMVHAARDGQPAPVEEPREPVEAPKPREPAEERPGSPPITVPEVEPVSSTTATDTEAEAAPAERSDPERQRSLRELFWGED
ncbi:MAG TPA: DivIVA domain-containing protein [Actinomycetota bacterium]